MSGNRRVRTPRERRRQRLAFWSLCGLLLAYAVLGGDYKLHHLVFVASEKDRVERRIEQLRAENAMLAEHEKRLESDTLLLERLAREKGMKKEGEVVYRLMPVRPSAPPEPPGEDGAGAGAAGARPGNGAPGAGAERPDSGPGGVAQW